MHIIWVIQKNIEEEEKKQLTDIGGRSYLTSLANSVPTASHVIHYAKITKGLTLKIEKSPLFTLN